MKVYLTPQKHASHITCPWIYSLQHSEFVVIQCYPKHLCYAGYARAPESSILEIKSCTNAMQMSPKTKTPWMCSNNDNPPRIMPMF